MGYKITIDGPSGSGKGFVASEVSKRLGILNIDTGAMYRALGLFCAQNEIDLNNEESVKKALLDANIDFGYDGEILKIYLNGEDVSPNIRTEQVGMLASIVSAIPTVREFMIDRQRELAGLNNVVMEGRDIGSVVFPNAELKIFLTASELVRAKRRLGDLLQKGKEVTLEQVEEDIKKRDEADKTRSISPLIKTEDMVQIDTTYMDKEQVINEVLNLIKERKLISEN